jgi:hypothetical protein
MNKRLLGGFFSDGRRVEITGNVIAMLEDINTGRKRFYHGSNLVGISGNKYYAYKMVGGSLFLVNGMRLGTASVVVSAADIDVTTSINSAGAKLSIDATYPMQSDTDTNNSGRGSNVVTWRVTFSAATFSQVGVRELALVDAPLAPTQALTHALFAAAFDKTLTDTLTVYVNHTITGI